jgi:hypothetical protein
VGILFLPDPSASFSELNALLRFESRGNADKALRDLQMAYLIQKYPLVKDCMATRKQLDEACDGRGLDFRVQSFEIIIQDDPNFLSSLAHADSEEAVKQNAAVSAETLKTNLIGQLAQERELESVLLHS